VNTTITVSGPGAIVVRGLLALKAIRVEARIELEPEEVLAAVRSLLNVKAPAPDQEE
jgi:hypothetical protein